MPYLVVGRRLDEKIVLRLAPGADEQALIEHLRTDGIEIVMASEGNVRIGVRAPEEIQILRAELLKKGPGATTSGFGHVRFRH